MEKIIKWDEPEAGNRSTEKLSYYIDNNQKEIELFISYLRPFSPSSVAGHHTQ